MSQWLNVWCSLWSSSASTVAVTVPSLILAPRLSLYPPGEQLAAFWGKPSKRWSIIGFGQGAHLYFLYLKVLLATGLISFFTYPFFSPLYPAFSSWPPGSSLLPDPPPTNILLSVTSAPFATSPNHPTLFLFVHPHHWAPLYHQIT